MLQSFILLLNRTPLSRWFRRLYALAVQRLVADLAKNPAVFCIFGCGSYFDDRATYGLSDVDLIIVLNDRVKRSDAAPREIAHAYERVRRVFPFLGRWYEKEANLIFLSDIEAGFPFPESFRVRFKTGRLVPLYGGPLPPDIISGPVTVSEVLAELNTLIRLSLVTEARTARRMVFWKRIFGKLVALAELADLPRLAADIRAHDELRFLDDTDTKSFFRAAQPERFFSLLLRMAQGMCDALRSREPTHRVRLKVSPSCLSQQASTSSPEPPVSSAVIELARAVRFSVKYLPSIPIGLAPRLLYFSIDEPILLMELHEGSYQGLQRLRRAMDRHPVVDENALVSVDGWLFVATRQPTFVDLVPLDSLQFANIYAALCGEVSGFEMPSNVFNEQFATATAIFRGLAHLYRVHDRHVTKLAYPCIYREDDAEVFENAVRILRARVANSEHGMLIESSDDLFDYLRQQHPECDDFLTELQRYRRSYYDDSAERPAANNLYHCLHQFMWQFLDGQKTIALDPIQQHLDITVGVITRNRAEDLAQMLDSLTRQLRPPDEVLVVDNGSTDHTKAVLGRFSDRLPIEYRFLAEANIPSARNLVIEEAAHDIVSFIDDDCISEPEWLAAVERGFLRADNIGIVGGWVRHEPAPHPSSVDNYYRVFHHTKS